MSLGWGLWEQATGLTAGLAGADRERMARLGLRPLPADDGLALLDLGVDADRAHLVPARFELSALRGGDPPAMLRALAGAAPSRGPGRPEEGQSLRDRLLALPEHDREVTVRRLVQAEVASVLGRSGAGEASAERGFTDLGFDSLTALELRNRLGRLTGLTLTATVTFDHPSPSALTRHLLERLAPPEFRPAAGPVAAEPPVPGPVAEEPLLTALDRLEESVTAVADDALRSAVTTRLWELLAAVGSAQETAAPVHDHEVAAASADELFALIDDELGRP
ncbi:hypothetical protein IHE61_04245 [Streptomyces sp. GKU 257-1]|nr:hypothetical protein [Streptomyces sp. GKU 257-1]